MMNKKFFLFCPYDCDKIFFVIEHVIVCVLVAVDLGGRGDIAKK